MQHLSGEPDADAARLAARLGAPAAQVAAMAAQARRLMADPELARFFDPRRFVRALDEWPVATAEGELRRIDRMVELDDAVWVLDYKTGGRASVAAAIQAEYRAQVQSYCAALRPVFPAKPVFGLVLFADGSTIAVDAAQDD
jgi:ATP-dependent helicase/nuclease subunit A